MSTTHATETLPTPSSMTVADAIATATAHGWSDDSRWTPSKIHTQITALAHGLLSAVRISVDGTIDWRVTRHEETAPPLPTLRHGQAPTVTEAVAACHRTVAAATSTLF